MQRYSCQALYLRFIQISLLIDNAVFVKFYFDDFIFFINFCLGKNISVNSYLSIIFGNIIVGSLIIEGSYVLNIINHCLPTIYK